MKASDILNQIKEVLGMELSSVEIKLEEKKLNNGTKIEAESFEKGKSVFIKTEDDEKLALPVGEYTLEDGSKLIVEEEGKISEMKKEDEEYEKEDEEKMDEEADVADWKGMEKRIKNLEDAVADLKGDKQDRNEEEVEASEEVKEEVKEELKEELKEVKEEEEKVEASKTELSEVEVSAEPISHNPEAEVKKHNVQFARNRSRNTLDRVLEKINQ